MPIRIAIPEPTSRDPEYNTRSLPPYIAALQACGAIPTLVPLHERQDRVAQLLAGTQGVLLPGSRFDVDPERYGDSRIPECGPSDPERAAVDELLLQDAFNLHKPILAICHGMQTLNVWLNGTLIQHLPAVSSVDHAPGRDVIDAHLIQIEEGSMLQLLNDKGEATDFVNSSHHQAIARLGDRLTASAVSGEDGVIEAVEIDALGQFVLGVQWHPERTFAAKPLSRAIFKSFVDAASRWQPAPSTVAEAAR
ncbi:gamma-glutamyl-gamma-aminobutyrate hydrolase family protein [Occallatibacter savannae]|uniref:gamma-glutamyl-gamma-aminobutyrate hydrolase family protein n=1 Tax=Occallatibacter savannae TaxID=1002691 RepID=UPI000D696E20|nr:gamma-glutamyl-gamma-aminobutyrate hydrolase family protein [Occallatibacter savannae]